MIKIILILILIFEVIRLILYIRDSRNVARTNRAALKHQQRNEEFGKTMHEEWKLIRKAEIDELKQLAKDSDVMREIYEEYKSSYTEALNEKDSNG